MVYSGFRRCGHLSFIKQFWKKWHGLASTASDREGTRYQWKMVFSDIHSTIKDQYWLLWCQEWSCHQYQSFFLLKWGCMGHWGRGGCWGCRVSKAWKITREDILSHTGCWIQLYFDVLKTTIFGYNPEISRWIFSTFSVWGCWGQRISLFLKLVD